MTLTATGISRAAQDRMETVQGGVGVAGPAKATTTSCHDGHEDGERNGIARSYTDRDMPERTPPADYCFNCHGADAIYDDASEEQATAAVMTALKKLGKHRVCVCICFVLILLFVSRYM